MLLYCINISATSLIILAVAVKHLIYTEKSNIIFEKYEPNNDSSCGINCCSRSINDGIYCTRTTRIGMGRLWRLWRLWRLGWLWRLWRLWRLWWLGRLRRMCRRWLRWRLWRILRPETYHTSN